MKTQNNNKKWLRIFYLIFIVLLSVSIPIKYNVLILNKYIIIFFEKTTIFFGKTLNLNSSNHTLELHSDSTGLYIHIGLIFILSILLALVNSFFISKTVINKLRIFLFTYTSYFLALQMLIYGFSKVFKWQFYDAHPNTLYTPLRTLTKDFLYWTSMGTSYLYNITIGCTEVVIGIFLLFKTTRYFGALIGFFATLHITLINFSFDINVKIQSLFLLCLFFSLISPNLKILYLLFIKKKRVSLTSTFNNHFKLKNRFYFLLKFLIISLIFTEALYPYFYTNNFNGDLKTKPPFYGAYKIENNTKYKRFFIHSDPYFIIQDFEDKLYSFPLEYTTKGIKVSFNNKQSLLKLTSNTSTANKIKVDGLFFGDSLKFTAKKIDISKSPIYKDDFHWTIDYYNKQ